MAGKRPNILILLALLLPLSAAAQSRDEFGLEEIKKNYTIDTSTPFRLRAEVDIGEVRVARGDSRDEIRVGLAYLQDQFHHSLRYNESRNQLEIVLKKKKWLEHERDRTIAELELELPDGGPLELDFQLKAGEMELQLGGLRVAQLAVEAMAGEVNLDFDEPNKIAMDNLDLNTKIGESKFRRLGNARFRNAEINGGIGEMTIDFSGDMLHEAVARVDLDIGETAIILPREAGTRIYVSKFLFLSHIDLPFELRKEGRYYYSENFDQADRTFQLRVSSGIGECRVELQ